MKKKYIFINLSIILVALLILIASLGVIKDYYQRKPAGSLSQAQESISNVKYTVLTDCGYGHGEEQYRQLGTMAGNNVGVEAMIVGINWKDVETESGYFDFSSVWRDYERCTQAGLLWVPHLAIHYPPSWMDSSLFFKYQDGTSPDGSPLNPLASLTEYYVNRFIQAFANECAQRSYSPPLIFVSIGQYGESYWPGSGQFASRDDNSIAAWRAYVNDQSAMTFASTTDTAGSGGTIAKFLEWWNDVTICWWIGKVSGMVKTNFPNSGFGLKVTYNESLYQNPENQAEAAKDNNLMVISFGGPLSHVDGTEEVGKVARDLNLEGYNIKSWAETFLSDYNGLSNSEELTIARMNINNISALMYATMLNLISGDYPPPSFQIMSDYDDLASLIGNFDTYKNRLTNWYFAEGATHDSFTTYIRIYNPTVVNANVQVVFMKPDKTTVSQSLTISPQRRTTIDVGQYVPNCSSVATQITADVPVATVREMYWDDYEGAHGSNGIQQPAETWYFAEGSTQPGFETWILILNPSTTETAQITITCMKVDQTTAEKQIILDPKSRHTEFIEDIVGQVDSVSVKVTSEVPVIAERAVYWNNRQGGHANSGTVTPATTWYFAEGSTQAGFETWIALQNPEDRDAQVRITCMTQTGDPVTRDINIGPTSRKTINVESISGTTDSVSTKVEVLNDVAIIAERPMYWNSRRGGHACAGATETASMLFLAGGKTSTSFETWLTFQNPNTTEAQLKVSCMKTDGTVERFDINVPATSRYTVNAASLLYTLKNADFSVKIESLNGVGVSVESSIYCSTDSQQRADGLVSLAVK